MRNPNSIWRGVLDWLVIRTAKGDAFIRGTYSTLGLGAIVSRATESNDVGQAILPAAAFQAAFSDVRESSIPANAG
jgi:hypothetical protein